MPRSGRDASTRTFAPATSPQATGTPSHGSALPHRPKPMSTYGLPSETRARFLSATSAAIARERAASKRPGARYTTSRMSSTIPLPMTWSEERRTLLPDLASCVRSTSSVETTMGRTCSRPSRTGGCRRDSSVAANSISTGPPAAFSQTREKRPDPVVDGEELVDEQRREVDDARARHSRPGHETVRGGAPRGRGHRERAVLFGLRRESPGRGTRSRAPGRRRAAFPC